MLSILFLGSVFVLALTRVHDPDVWIHLSLGRLIWNLKAFPATEPFVYPAATDPFLYSPWLFGVIYYLAYNFLTVHGMILLKALTVTAAFFILLRDSLRPHKNVLAAVVVLAFIVLAARHRFVERPDTFLMVFLPLLIFSLHAFVYDGKKYLYALPVMHLVWANSHSSINLFFVPFFAFIFGGLLQRYLSGKSTKFSDPPSLLQIRTIALVFAACFAASLINPYGIGQYFYGANVLASDWWKQEVIELMPPTWDVMKSPFILAPAVILSFFLNRKHISLIPIFLVLPLMILSFTSMRFCFIFSMVSGPVLVRNICSALSSFPWWRSFSSGKIAAGAGAACVVLCASLVLAGVTPFADKESADLKQFGFGIDYDYYPERALRFMDKKNITGRAFNIFAWGQYISWRDYPKRSAFIDGRGHLKNELLEETSQALHSPRTLEKLYDSYHFESILSDYPIVSVSASPLLETDKAVNHPDWALVYWDDLSLVYVRRGGPYDSVIKQDEYRYVKPANRFVGMKALLLNRATRAAVLTELQRAIAEGGSSKAYAFLGLAYNEIGLYEKAIDAFSHVRPYPAFQDHVLDRYCGIGYALGQLGDFDGAIRSYRQALKIAENPEISLNLATAYIKKGDKRKAIEYAEKTLNSNSTLVSAYPLLISLYQESSRPNDAKKTEERYKAALREAGAEEHFNRGLTAYAEGRARDAVEEFRKSIEKNPDSAAAYSNLGYVYFDTGMIAQSYACQRKAIDLEPDYANAHYGLALIYKKQGDNVRAREQFEDYLRLQPAGHFSRKAKQYIKDLRTKVSYGENSPGP